MGLDPTKMFSNAYNNYVAPSARAVGKAVTKPIKAVGKAVSKPIKAISKPIVESVQNILAKQQPVAPQPINARVLTASEVLTPIHSIADIINAKYLNQEGIFRTSGLHDSINSAINRIKNGENVDLDALSGPDLAGIAKQLLRDNQVADESTQTALLRAFNKDSDAATNVRQLRAAINTIKDPAVKDCLEECFLLLANVASCHKENKMNASNLGTSIGPSIFPSDSIESMTALNNLTAFMVAHASEIFRGGLADG